MKKILILILLLNYSLISIAKLGPTHWKAITIDIARDGDPTDRGEFEAAKQSFLNIALDNRAGEAALAIEKTWKANIGKEAEAFGDSSAGYSLKNPEPGTLMSLARYPKMDATQVHNAAVDLIEKPNIKNFLEGEGFKLQVPAKR